MIRGLGQDAVHDLLGFLELLLAEKGLSLLQLLRLLRLQFAEPSFLLFLPLLLEFFEPLVGRHGTCRHQFLPPRLRQQRRLPPRRPAQGVEEQRSRKQGESNNESG